MATYERQRIIRDAITEHAASGEPCSQKSYIAVCLQEASEDPLSAREVELHCGKDSLRAGEELHQASHVTSPSRPRYGPDNPAPWYTKPRNWRPPPPWYARPNVNCGR